MYTKPLSSQLIKSTSTSSSNPTQISDSLSMINRCNHRILRGNNPQAAFHHSNSNEVVETINVGVNLGFDISGKDHVGFDNGDLQQWKFKVERGLRSRLSPLYLSFNFGDRSGLRVVNDKGYYRLDIFKFGMMLLSWENGLFTMPSYQLELNSIATLIGLSTSFTPHVFTGLPIGANMSDVKVGVRFWVSTISPLSAPSGNLLQEFASIRRKSFGVITWRENKIAWVALG
ncbi:hypothetical protein Tco_1185961 [Tanacetum coccineum]